MSKKIHIGKVLSICIKVATLLLFLEYLTSPEKDQIKYISL